MFRHLFNIIILFVYTATMFACVQETYVISSSGETLIFPSGRENKGQIIIEGIHSIKEFPVIISSSKLERAVIYSGDSTCIHLRNCTNVIIRNMSLIGSGRLSLNCGFGILVENCENVTISDIDVSGYLFSGIEIIGGTGICVTNCTSHDNGFSGIHVNGDANDITISHCVANNNPGCPEILDNHSGNGIIIGNSSNVVIEYCEAKNNGWDMPRKGNGPVGIWGYATDSLVIRHCYSHDNKTSEEGMDGGGFDFDGGVTNSIMEYNLSCHNEGAGIGLFQYCGASNWSGNRIRYNVSIDDGVKNAQAGIHFWCGDRDTPPLSNSVISDNYISNSFGNGVYFVSTYLDEILLSDNIFAVGPHSAILSGDNPVGSISVERNQMVESFLTPPSNIDINYLHQYIEHLFENSHGGTL